MSIREQTLAVARRLRALRPAKRRRAPLPRPIPPTAIEREYYAVICRAIVEPARRAFAEVERRILDDLAAQIVAAEVKEDAFDPDQPRVPAGQSGGGQFGSGGSVAEMTALQRWVKGEHLNARDWSPQADPAFVSAIAKLPLTDSPVHRATAVTEAQLAQLVPGAPVTMAGYRSWTTEGGFAKDWSERYTPSGQRAVILSLPEGVAHDLSSINPLQAEAVTLPGKFVVVGRVEMLNYVSVSLAPSTRHDAKPPKRNGTQARRWLAEAARKMMAQVDTTALHKVTAKFGKRLNKHQQEQLDRQVRAAIGVEYKSLPQATLDKVEPWTRANVDLIVTVPERHFARLRADIDEAYSSGMRPETLAKRLRAHSHASEYDARRIARDQISKLNGELNSARQQTAGIKGYIWRSGRDNRVRDNHGDLDGTEQLWAEPPMGGGTDETEPGHPGDGIQCRCYAEPDLSALLE